MSEQDDFFAGIDKAIAEFKREQRDSLAKDKAAQKSQDQATSAKRQRLETSLRQVIKPEADNLIDRAIRKHLGKKKT